jgi:hypothetical protein
VAALTRSDYSVITGAIEDALRPLGVKIDRMPLGACELRELIRRRTPSG